MSSMHSFRAKRALEKELEYIKQVLGTSETQAIAESVHSYYKSLKKKKKEKKSLIGVFDELGLIGGASAEEDLSENYKEKLAESIAKKHHDRK